MKPFRPSSDRTGAMLPLIAVTLVIIFIGAVLAIDIARIHVTRSELRTATDAAARAAVEALGREQNTQSAIDAALAIASRNMVAGEGLTLDPNAIQFGTSVENPDGSFRFSENASARAINSVHVIGDRTAGSPDGPVNMLFARMFGTDTFEPIQTATATRLDRDIALVLDKSGSMKKFGRFDALLNGVEVFLEELDSTSQQENVSLVAYDKFPRKLVDMTPNLPVIFSSISAEQPQGRTGIGRALDVGLDSVLNDPNSRNFSLKSIVLMTDGNQNEGEPPIGVARRCAAAGVVVHTITFSNGADIDLMEEVATIAKGTHLHAETDEQLVEAFETIARQIQVLLIE